ncbi:MAG: DsbA family protein [Nanoarchaeota archaeon]|nr:DsbA family protein [Nanoarchaeota archaeon]MBU1270082.1 DsbA family protein [Nanoarchaeota archaeon]MBU1604989.1 DsbA family protein [Nanoarchaeota archaeon]MBU2443418.1 DsbA family protein [Nanoarchaeota archaeon]
MICIIALFVFGILGVFSAKYRLIAKEAFDCVFRKLTFRRCDSRLDSRLKAQITGKLMKRHQGLGRQIYKNFEIISWIFTILLFVSLFYSGQGIYYFAKYGNCNGPDNNGFCIFDPLNNFGNNNESETLCHSPELQSNKTLSFSGSIDNNPFIGNKNASITIVEFGCFSCPNTKTAVPEVKKLIDKYNDSIMFVYLDFPLPNHALSYESSLAASCIWINNPDKYWDYNFKIFDNQEKLSLNLLRQLTINVGADIEKFDSCLLNNESKALVDSDYQAGLDSNVYGTPTFFINNKPYVGVISFKKFKEIIESEQKKE